MVRTRLAHLGQQPGWHTFVARVRGRSWAVDRWWVVLVDVRADAGDDVADHLWVYPETFDHLGIEPGTWVRFRAHPYHYTRLNGTEDWSLRDVGRVKVLDGRPVLDTRTGGARGDGRLRNSPGS